ncbi:MAG TPA: HIT family protein [Chlamydiales bacterium]|nr:HIT family protein [Chlamydiales bacterium]
MCIFCNIPKEEKVFEDKHCFAFFDQHPVTPDHCLIIPNRHFPDFFEASQEEILSFYAALKHMKELLEKNDPSIKGFNIGINIGEVAGQSIFHLHIHLIPRREKDTPSPKGGVRGVIPTKMGY